MHIQVLYDALKFSSTQLRVYGESATGKEGTGGHTWGVRVRVSRSPGGSQIAQLG